MFTFTRHFELCALGHCEVGRRAATSSLLHQNTSPSKETHEAAVSYPQEATEKKEEELTVAMMKALPQLLRKYQADKAKVMDLVEVTAYLKLELYSLKRQEPVRKLSSSSSSHVGALAQEGKKRCDFSFENH